MDAVKEFKPHWALRNRHLMTIAGSFWRRKFPRLPASVPRFFEVEPGSRLRGECHWQKNHRGHPTLLLIHGLEGSSDSAPILGVAEKAWLAGFNVVRLNQRNCGGTENLTSTLYHSGRSADFRAVLLELIERDALLEIFFAGFSMGGNLILKMAGEFGAAAPPQLRGLAAVAPCFDLATCADALCASRNFIYNRHFVVRLKKRMRHKAGLYPEVYPANGQPNLEAIHTVRDFDEMITAPFCGFASADDYYARSSAMHVLAAIARPTLILTAADDPIIPLATFEHSGLKGNSNITVIASRYGGHCAFISQENGDERFWAEARIVEFCRKQSQLLERQTREVGQVSAGS